MERQQQYEKALNNIYLDATTINISSGMTWYYGARRRCEVHAKRFKMPLYQFIAIVAALSPQKQWERNIDDAVKFVKYKGNHKLFATKVMLKKCHDILNAQESEIEGILKGNKITSFYNNIYKPFKSDKVTIDRHAMRSVNMQGVLTDKKYREIERAHVNVARNKGIKAHELQAIIWLVVR